MTKDTLSPSGAHALSIAIQAFWKSRGVTGVRVQAVRIKLNGNSTPANMWSLRSNLIFDAKGNAVIKENEDEEFDAGPCVPAEDRDIAQRPLPRSKQPKPNKSRHKAKSRNG